MDDSTKQKWKDLFGKIHTRYVVVLLIALVIFMLGDQGLWKGYQRKQKIRRTEALLEQTRRDIRQCEKDIQTLQSTDSLERYAREHFYMHADNEDVYLIDE